MRMCVRVCVCVVAAAKYEARRFVLTHNNVKTKAAQFGIKAKTKALTSLTAALLFEALVFTLPGTASKLCSAPLC